MQDAVKVRANITHRYGDLLVHDGLALDVALRHLLDAKARTDVVAHAEPRQRRRLLEHERDVVPLGIDLVAVDRHLALRRLHDPGEDVEQCRLATA
ncbi:MAG TPA: hypothetical protein VGL96_08370, partial [Casimicrobiaceae bacterium]